MYQTILFWYMDILLSAPFGGPHRMLNLTPKPPQGTEKILKDTITLFTESLRRNHWETHSAEARIQEEDLQDYPWDKRLPLHRLSVDEMSVAELQLTRNCLDTQIARMAHIDITTIDAIDVRTMNEPEAREELPMLPIEYVTFLSPFRTRKFVIINSLKEIVVINEVDIMLDDSLPQTNVFSEQDIILPEEQSFAGFDDEPTKPFISLQSLKESDEIEIHIEVCGFDDEKIEISDGDIVAVEESDIISEVTLTN